MNKRKVEIINKIEERIINSRVKDAIDYLDIINHETDLMYDDTIYKNTEEFFVIFYGGDTLGAIRAIKYGTYNFDDNYVVFNEYKNLESYSSQEIKEYIKCIAHDMAAILAEDYINGEGKFKGLEIYKDL